MPATENPQQLEVWMDGGCRLCRRSQTWCEQRDRDERVIFRDFRDTDDVDLPVTRKAHEQSMWVRSGDGELHRGFAAWRLVMNELPGWRWLARISGLPPFKWFGPTIYRLVARYRSSLR